MKLPFSESQFLDVFAAYNRALWPVVLLVWLVTAAFALLWLFRGRGVSGRWLSGLLAFHWAWSGLVYHLLFFARINPAARGFAVLFLAQAIAFAWIGVVRGRLAFARPASWRGVFPAALVLYALAYPFVGIFFRLNVPRMPIFAVPCPTTLFTAGLLLSTAPRAPRWLLVIPLAWCVIAASAAFTLGIRADLALVVAAAGLAGHALLPRGAHARAVREVPVLEGGAR